MYITRDCSGEPMTSIPAAVGECQNPRDGYSSKAVSCADGVAVAHSFATNDCTGAIDEVQTVPTGKCCDLDGDCSPSPSGCTGCLPAGVPDCYAACAAQSADTPYGQCRYPGSVDPTQCCLCATAMCPSTHPFIYRPSRGPFDACCATGDSTVGVGLNAVEELDARDHRCKGGYSWCRNANNQRTKPCIDYAPPPPPAAPPPPPSAPPALPPGATLQREVRAAPSRRQHLLRRPPPLLPHTPPHCR